MAGLGGVFGDYLIFRFLKDRVFEEIKPILKKIGKPLVNKLIFTPRFSWIVPVLGAIIIASPFPDEIGISLMGLSKIKNWQFVLISFILNSLGILFMIMIIKSFKIMLSKNIKETEKIAKIFLDELLKRKKKPKGALVVGLWGFRYR